MRTDNYIYKAGHAPEGVRSIIPAKHRIFAPQVGQAGLTMIGNCTQLSISESRTVEPVRGIGKGMQIAELVPGAVEPVSLSVNLFALYLADMMQIFGFNAGVDGFVRSLKHHQWPFDIKGEQVLTRVTQSDPANTGNTNAIGKGTQKATSDGFFNNLSGYSERAIITIYEACYMESYSQETQDSAATVTQNCELKVTDVVDGRYTARIGAATGNEPSSTGGSLRNNVGNQLQGLLGNLLGI